jgi:leader peptidase (prepilin peptidase)/N-methyltransferase
MTGSYSDIAAAWPWFFPAAAFVLGACVGSFLNVVIRRLPAGESVVFPGSHCACGAPIAWRDNIPIASWLFLRGRARCCGRPFSARYPAVELLTALLFLGCWLLFPPAKAVCGMVFLGALLAATFIDLDHMIIPDALSIGLGVAGVVLSFLVPALHGQQGGFYALDSLRSGGIALVGLFVGSGLVLWIALLAEAVVRKEAMGFGDVKFAGAIGAFVGWQGAVFAVFGGAVIGSVGLVLMMAWKRAKGRPRVGSKPGSGTAGPGPADGGPVGFGMRVPFGPMLAAAAAVYFLGADAWVRDYLSRLAGMF